MKIDIKSPINFNVVTLQFALILKTICIPVLKIDRIIAIWLQKKIGDRLKKKPYENIIWICILCYPSFFLLKGYDLILFQFLTLVTSPTFFFSVLQKAKRNSHNINITLIYFPPAVVTKNQFVYYVVTHSASVVLFSWPNNMIDYRFTLHFLLSPRLHFFHRVFFFFLLSPGVCLVWNKRNVSIHFLNNYGSLRGC